MRGLRIGRGVKGNSAIDQRGEAFQLDFRAAEADIGLIREGQKARFTVDAFPNRNFTDDVQQIRLNPTNQQNVVTYNVRVNVANPDHLLLPGMTAYVNIGVARRDDALLVPNAALRFKPPEADGSVSKNGSAAGQERGKGKKHGQRGGRQGLEHGQVHRGIRFRTRYCCGFGSRGC